MVIWWASGGHVGGGACYSCVWWGRPFSVASLDTMSLRPQELTDWCRVIISVQGVCSRAGCRGPRPTCGSIHTPSTVKDWQTHILNIYSKYWGEVFSRTIQNDFENCFLKNSNSLAVAKIFFTTFRYVFVYLFLPRQGKPSILSLSSPSMVIYIILKSPIWQRASLPSLILLREYQVTCFATLYCTLYCELLVKS